MFVVAGAESMGDPDAEVFSYGELANGMTGNVGPGSSPSETSESTYKSDRAFWLGLAGKNNAERATQHTTRIRASSSRVASFARALREDTPYGLVSIFGLWQKELISTNSNAAALAVANRATSFGKASPVYMQLPDPIEVAEVR